VKQLLPKALQLANQQSITRRSSKDALTRAA
jgi:hypothetical protein